MHVNSRLGSPSAIRTGQSALADSWLRCTMKKTPLERLHYDRSVVMYTMTLGSTTIRIVLLRVEVMNGYS